MKPVSAADLAARLACAASAMAQDAPPPVAPPTGPAPADDAAALPQKLSNPVASLISVPFQFNFDGAVGPETAGERIGERITINVQPVIPISLNAEWNLISRTIEPLVWQNDIGPGSASKFGLGDTVPKPVLQPGQSITWSPTTRRRMALPGGLP